VSLNNATVLVHRLREAGHEAFLVGGCVRDQIRGVTPQDFDIVTSARPEEVQVLFRRTIPVGARFGVVMVIEGKEHYEVATFRKETGYDDGRRPSVVSFATAEEDVRRRDFTVNGLLMDPETGAIIDYVDGRRDIGQRLIRTIGDPDERFAEDHLRMLRAVRFAATLDFTLDPATHSAVRRQVASIRRISAERIKEELTRILMSRGARRGMELLLTSGLLAELLPEILALRGVNQPPTFHPEGDVWEHTLRMVDLLAEEEGAADPRLAWSVLFHDVGKAVTRSEDATGVHFYGHVREGEQITAAILDRLRFSREEIRIILELVRGHMLFINVRKMRPNRLKRFLRQPEFALHLQLHRLDCLGSHGLLDSYDFCLRKLDEYSEEDLRPPPLLRGADLIKMGYRPGPVFKEILRVVEDAQLGGDIVTSEDACRFVRLRWGTFCLQQCQSDEE
jgi:poly(A) polymerase